MDTVDGGGVVLNYMAQRGGEPKKKKDVTTAMDGLGVEIRFGCLLWMLFVISIDPLGYTIARSAPLGYAVCLHGILV